MSYSNDRWRELVSGFPVDRAAYRLRKPRRDSRAVIAAYQARWEQVERERQLRAAMRRLEQAMR